MNDETVDPVIQTVNSIRTVNLLRDRDGRIIREVPTNYLDSDISYGTKYQYLEGGPYLNGWLTILVN